MANDEWDGEETQAVDFAAEPDSDGQQAPFLLISSGSRRGERVAVVHGLTIGRGQEALLRLRDHGVSRVHLRFEVQADGSFAVFDTGSRNGTQVNGKPMRSSIMHDGDVIFIGSGTTMRFCAGSFEEAHRSFEEASDRRTDPRVPLLIKIDYPSVEDFLQDYSLNLSSGGMRIYTSQELQVGDVLDMRLTLPGLVTQVEVEGVVRWVRRDPEQQEAVAGVRLEHRDEASRQALANLVDRVVAGDLPALGMDTIRILLADDNVKVVDLINDGLRRAFARSGQEVHFEAVHAADGREALTLIQQQTFRLAVVESCLPVVDGEHLIRAIRDDPRLDELLIVAVSREGVDSKPRLMQAGADFFFVKPLRLVDLLQTLQRLGL